MERVDRARDDRDGAAGDRPVHGRMTAGPAPVRRLDPVALPGSLHLRCPAMRAQGAVAAMSGYCDIAPSHPVHGPYHDHEYGFVQRDEAVLFERLLLEINQAGLSWETVLRKRAGFRLAYEGFDVDKVAAYGEFEQARLLADTGIIRNRLKVQAAIHNARVIQRLRASHGSFACWLDAHIARDGSLRDKAGWVTLFKQTFRFTGGEITGEFLMSLGYLPGAHRENCPVFAHTLAAGAPWAIHAV